MEINNFKQILAWQKAHQLTLIVYKAVGHLPDYEKYNLISQMIRAAVSVGANIVEGFARLGLSDSLRFYNIAEASLEELKYHTLLCFDRGYFNQQQYQYLSVLEDEVGRVLKGWIKSQIKNKKDFT
ncbi:four helix bundle protein [Candidatus Kuenenbacteria bacterium]|nr:four helix bundle protein [Candidatus Kuenenbacteria bacterium]